MSSSFRRAPSSRNDANTSIPANDTKSNSSSFSSHNNSIGGISSNSSDRITRKGAAAALHKRGTKPWTGGTYLTSSGQRELDGILGGGQPLGTCLLIEEDRWTDLGLVLARYWAAESVSHGQHLLFAETKSEQIHSLPRKPSRDGHSNESFSSSSAGSSIADIRAFLSSLPRDQHLDKFLARKKKKESDGDDVRISNQSALLASPLLLEEEEEEEEEDDRREDPTSEHHEDGLKIAWQYRSSVQKERTGIGSSIGSKTHSKATNVHNPNFDIYCHSYDLSGRMHHQCSLALVDNSNASSSLHENNGTICVVDCCSSFSGRNAGFLMYQTLLTYIRKVLDNDNTHESKTDDGGGSPVIRLLLLNAPPAQSSVAIPLLLTTIREHNLPVAIMLTIQPWLSSIQTTQDLMQLERTCDTIFTIDGFSGRRERASAEFRDLVGILTVKKVGSLSLGNFYNKRPPALRYGLKRDRRKMHIQMLHLPPEDYSEGGSSVSGGGARTGGGMKKSPKVKASSLDF